MKLNPWLPKALTSSIGTLLITSFCAQADEYHYQNLLVGGESVGLGGAYMALYNDLSTAHYNPAGLAFTKVRNTTSVNTFAWEDTTFKGVFGNGEDFDRNSFAIVPGFWSLRFAENGLSGAVSFAVSDYNEERSVTDVEYVIEGTADVSEFAFINIDNTTYELGLSGAYTLSSNWSVGISMKGKYSDFQTIQGSGTTISYLGFEQPIQDGLDARRRYGKTSLMLSPAFGLLWQNNGLSTGLRISKDYEVDRDYDSTANLNVSMPTRTLFYSHRERSKHTDTQELPTQIALGAAYQAKRWLVSFDVSHYSEVKEDIPATDSLGIPITRTLDSVVNYALGTKFKVKEDLAFSLGIFTDNSNAKIDPSVPYERVEDIDLVGYSLAVQFKLWGYATTFGAYYKQGTGKVRLADIRGIEAALGGVQLYPQWTEHDIVDAEKRTLVAYLSLDF